MNSVQITIDDNSPGPREELVTGAKEIALAAPRRIYEACLRRDGRQAEEETAKHLEQVFMATVRITRHS